MMSKTSLRPLAVALALSAAMLGAAVAPAAAATRAEAAEIAALKAQVQGLLDREAIRQLMLDYSRTIDSRDWKTHASLFADKVEVEGGRVRTRDDLLRGKQGFFGALPATQHIGLVLSLDIKGDEAHVVTLLHAQHYLPNDYGDPVQRMIGTYDYWLTRTPDGWKIHKYVHNTAWNEGNYWIYQKAGEAARVASDPAPR